MCVCEGGGGSTVYVCSRIRSHFVLGFWWENLSTHILYSLMCLCMCVFVIEEQFNNPPQLVIHSFPVPLPTHWWRVWWENVTVVTWGDCRVCQLSTLNWMSPWQHYLACQCQSSLGVLHTYTCPRVYKPKPAHVHTQASLSTLPSDCLKVCQLLLVQSKLYLEMTDLREISPNWYVCGCVCIWLMWVYLYVEVVHNLSTHFVFLVHVCIILCSWWSRPWISWLVSGFICQTLRYDHLLPPIRNYTSCGPKDRSVAMHGWTMFGPHNCTCCDKIKLCIYTHVQRCCSYVKLAYLHTGTYVHWLTACQTQQCLWLEQRRSVPEIGVALSGPPHCSTYRRSQ